MEDCEANCVVIRSLFGSYLSDINKNMILWYYGILLPEEEEDCSLSYLLNLTIDELKKILELCGLITINNNIVKLVRSPSGHGCSFSWHMFLLENLLSNNYVSQMNLLRCNKKYQRNIYVIGLDVEGDTKINPSTQFQLKKVNLRSWIDYYNKKLIKWNLFYS